MHDDELTSDMSWLSNLHIHDQTLLVALLVCDGNADSFAKKEEKNLFEAVQVCSRRMLIQNY